MTVALDRYVVPVVAADQRLAMAGIAFPGTNADPADSNLSFGWAAPRVGIAVLLGQSFHPIVELAHILEMVPAVVVGLFRFRSHIDLRHRAEDFEHGTRAR